jgi:hypothetical protein
MPAAYTARADRQRTCTHGTHRVFVTRRHAVVARTPGGTGAQPPARPPLGRRAPRGHASARKLLAGKRELPELILASGYPGLDLLPADFSYRNFAVHLAQRRHPTERLLKMSRSLREIYDVLFLDQEGWTDLALLPARSPDYVLRE